MPSKHSARSRGARASACRECGALASEGAQISARDLCLDCGKRRATMPADQMSAREGPIYDAWKVGVVEYARRLINS